MSDIAVEPTSEPKRRSPVPVVLGALALVALVAGVVVVASDGNDGGGDAVALLSAAPDAAHDAGTARTVITVTVEGGGMNLTMEGEGAVDFASGAQELSMSMMGIDLEMRFVDQVVYLRMPDVARPPSVDTEWIAFSAEAAGGQVGAGANPMASMQNGAAMLDALRGISRDVDELGAEEINGQDATGYRVTIDMAKAIEQLPEDRRAEARASLDQMAAMGMDEWPMDVWLNDDGLPVRMSMDMGLPAGDIGEGASMRVQIDFLDFGADLAVEAPPTAEVTHLSGMTELDELFGAAGATIG
jgi:hypothetical protein